MYKPVLFKDLKKRSNDLLTKEFPGDKSERKLEYKGDTSSGVGFETSFVQDDKGTITSTLKPKFSIKEYKAEVNGEFNTKQDVKVELSLQDQFASGLKTLTSINNKKGELFGAVGFEFKNDISAVNATFDLGKKSGPTAAIGAVFGTDGFSFGVSTTYLVSKSSLEGFEAVGSYKVPEFDAHLFGRVKPDEKTKKDTQEVGFAYFHNVSSDLSFGAEGQYNLVGKNLEVLAGLQFQPTVDSIFKGKFSNTGVLGLSYQQKFNSRTKFTLSSAFDLTALQQGKSGTTFGFGLNFNA